MPMNTSLKNRLRIQTILRLSQVAQLLKRREFMLELKRLIALPFLSSKKKKKTAKNLKDSVSFHVVVVQGQQRNVQKRVMHVKSCCFAN